MVTKDRSSLNTGLIYINIFALGYENYNHIFFCYVNYIYSIYFYPALQCMKRLPEESRADESLIPVISLWKHEMHRIIRDRISRTADLNWFDQTISGIIDSVCYFHLFAFTHYCINMKQLLKNLQFSFYLLVQVLQFLEQFQ